MRDENGYFALFGVSPEDMEPPADHQTEAPAPEKGQGEPDGTEPQQEENREESQAPGKAQQSEATESAADSGKENHENAEEKKTELTREQRARNAQRRRQQELDKAIAKAKEEAKAEMLKAIKLTDRYHDNKPIETLEEFEAWAKEDRTAALQNAIRAGNLTPEVLQDVISLMAEQKNDTQAAMEEAEAVKEQAQNTVTRQVVEKELEQIRKWLPEAKIQTIGDILAMDTAEDFKRFVEAGNTFQDAFRLANFDAILQRNQAAAQRKALNDVQGKSHLKASNPQSGKGIVIDPETRRYYKMFRPDLTDEQIQKELLDMKGT